MPLAMPNAFLLITLNGLTAISTKYEAEMVNKNSIYDTLYILFRERGQGGGRRRGKGKVLENENGPIMLCAFMNIQL